MLEIRNPYNKDLLATIEMSSEEEAHKKIGTALKAWKDRKNYPKKERIELLRNFKELVKKNRHDIAMKATKEGGKPLKDSLVEIDRAISGIDWTISSLAELNGKQIPTDTPLFHMHIKPYVVVILRSYSRQLAIVKERRLQLGTT